MSKKKSNLKNILTPMEFFKLRGQEAAVNELPLENLNQKQTENT